jgi:translation initiation factor IF-3
MAHIELGQQKLDLMAEVLEDAATIEQRPRLEGRSMSMVLMPK